MTIASADYVFSLIRAKRYSEAKALKIEENFTWGEVFGSIQGSEWNEVTLLALQNCVRTAGYMQFLRNRFGPLKVTSWYRPSSYNKRVGGATKSLHLKGFAVDFVPIQATLENVYRYLDVYHNGGLALHHKLNFIHLDRRGNKVRFRYG